MAKIGLGFLYTVSIALMFFIVFLVYQQMNFEGNFDCLVEKEPLKVQGTSMEPMIEDGREMTVVMKYYDCNEISRNDIILYRYAGSEDPLIKRVVGVPGDTFSYIDGRVVINGEDVKNSAGVTYNIDSNLLRLYANSYPVIRENTYLILGDNPQGTLDSSRFGLINKKDVLGRVVVE